MREGMCHEEIRYGVSLLSLNLLSETNDCVNQVRYGNRKYSALFVPSDFRPTRCASLYDVPGQSEMRR